MASVIVLADLKLICPTSLPDVQLQIVVNRIEGRVTTMFGPNYVEATPITETRYGGTQHLFFKRKITSVSAVVEDGVTLASTDYLLKGQSGMIQRLPSGAYWGTSVAVTYIPFDDNLERADVITEILRLHLARTAFRSESIAGEWSYTAADNPEVGEADILRRLALRRV